MHQSTENDKKEVGLINTKKKIGFICAGVIIIISALFIVQRYSRKQDSNKIQIDLYLNSPCASCNENVKFDEAIRKQIASYEINRKDTFSIVCCAHNTFKVRGQDEMSKALNKLELSKQPTLPFAIYQGMVYEGTYEEIGDNIAKAIYEHN